MKIERGGVYLVDLEPRSFKEEPGKTRPVVVLQSDLLNAVNHPSTIICPLTTKVIRSAVLLRVDIESKSAGLDRQSQVLIDQIRSIDNKRFIQQLGKVSSRDFFHITTAIAKILDL